MKTTQTVVVAVQCEYLFWEVVYKTIQAAIDRNSTKLIDIEYLAGLVCKSPGGRYFDKAAVLGKLKSLIDNGE